MRSFSDAELLSSLLVGLAVGLWIYWLWTRRNLYRFAWSFPGTWGLPISGSLHNIGSNDNILKYFEAVFRKCKTYTLCFWLGTYPMLLTAHPDFIEQVMSSPDMQNKAEMIYKSLSNTLNGGLVTSGGQIWNKNRKLINPGFSHKVLVSFLPVFHKTSLDAVNSLEKLSDDGIAHDFLSVFQRMATHNSFETTMGHIDPNAAHSLDKLVKTFQYALGVITAQMLYGPLHLDWVFKFHYKFHKCLEYLFVIENKLKSDNGPHNLQNTESHDLKKPCYIFIDRAVEAFRNKQFTIDDMVTESHTILIAAAETTGLTLYSTVVLLAMHPEAQERLYEEIISSYPTKDVQVRYEDFKQLPYLAMVINEVLRLTPSVPVIGRQVVKDTRLGKDLLLPKGLQVMISIFNLHRRKDIWGEHAEKFDPEHFLPTNTANLHPFAFIPFSKGSRNCIGWRYGIFSVKVALCHLVRNFRLETDTKLEELRFGGNISLKYLMETKIRIYKRN